MKNIGNIIKTLQNIIRKDQGVSGDAQRIEQLGWMITLKIIDDKDTELELIQDNYKSPIPKKLQWRNWAADSEGATGDALKEFVDQKLFPGLKNIDVSGGNKRALIIREIFEGTNNYMKNGTIIRQVLNQLNEINFNDSSDRHLFGDIYETILRDLQSAGNYGEFYTPRAITEFMTEIINPRLGEKVLDPACGTGGFLTSAIENIRKQDVKSVDDLKVLEKTIHGMEFKPLPFMLCISNLVLHDISVPNVDYTDSLNREYTSIGQKDKVDVILANPPFGASVADKVETNFPLNFRTTESADLFLLLMIRYLKDGGRAAIVLPDGSLTGDGVKSRIRQHWLETCNLHTIIRLPNSVFKPYATVATNLIFFTKGSPTTKIWYTQHQYPIGTKSYSKTNPIKGDDFKPIKDWWNNRKEDGNSWIVQINDIFKNGYDLDIKNPTSKQTSGSKSIQAHIESLRNDLVDIDSEIEEILLSITKIELSTMTELGSVCNVIKGNIGIKKAIPGDFPLVTTSEERGSHLEYQFDDEAVCIPMVSSTGYGHASIKRIHYQSGKFALGTILVAVIPKDKEKLSAKYLYYYLNNFKEELVVPLMKGMANVTLSVEKIKTIKLVVPSIEKQIELIQLMEKC
jgi:type I restriction enzyme M protein